MPSPMIDTLGVTHDVPDEHIDARIAQGWRPQTTDDVLASANASANEAAYGGVGGAVRAGFEGLARGISLGGYDVLAGAIGGEDAAIGLAGRRAENPVTSTLTEIGGNVAPILLSGGTGALGTAARLTPAGLAGRAGASVGAAAGGGLRGALAAGAVEGGLSGVGSGATELALSNDLLTWERAASAIGSNALFGAGIGAAAGGAFNAVERGLSRAATAIDDHVAERATRRSVESDLVGLDRKGLVAAEDAELARIEAARVGHRAEVADEIAAFREDLRGQKIWLTTKKGADEVPPAGVPEGRTPTPDPEEEFLNQLNAKNALGEYQNGGYLDVQEFARTGKVGAGSRFADKGEADAYLKTLDAATQSSTVADDTVVYRGIGSGRRGADRGIKGKVEVGEIIEDPGYSSMSTSRDVAFDYTNKPGSTMLEVELPKGAKYGALPDDGLSESEWLLPRGSKLRVLDVRQEVIKGRDVRIARARLEHSGAPSTGSKISGMSLPEIQALQLELDAKFGTVKSGSPEYEDLSRQWDELVTRKRVLAGEIAPPPASTPVPHIGGMSDSQFDSYQTPFISALTEEEKAAALSYSGGSHGTINRALRTGESPSAKTAQQIDLLDSMIAKSSTPADLVVIRAVNEPRVLEQYRSMKPGDTFVEKGFSSTSAASELPSEYRNAAIEFKIAVPRGTPAAPIPSLKNYERELLLPRGQRFRVDSVTHSADGKRTVIHASALPEASTIPPASAPQIEGLGPLGKRLLKTDRALDRLLDNPKALAARPQRALDALQMQEAAYEDLLGKSNDLRIKFAADTSGDRIAALDAIPAALERNRALQSRIGGLLQAPRTPRLDEIAAARDVLNQPARPKSMVEQAFGGTMFGALAGAVGSIPVLGQIPGVASFIGAKGAELASRLVFGKLNGAVGAQAERAGKAVKALLSATKTTEPYAPVVASKVLAKLRYGNEKRDKEPTTLPELYKARTDEVKQLTAYDETGTPRVRPEVRERIGKALHPIAVIDPIAADRIETHKVRGIEYLSSIIPRRPDIAGVPVGPDNWQPSDMAMRSWARSAEAVEDPYGVLERALHGAVTPEDAAAMRNVHIEILNDFTNNVMSQLPELRQSLPYDRQLALSILTGKAVTPALDPQILSVLQSQFPDEPGSEGGTQAPKAQPQFGSMQKSVSQPTPAQSRAQGAHV